MSMETIISICLGIGLAASAGFRVFVPLFALSVAAYFGVWPLNESWQWLGSTPALIILGMATIAESLGYLVPFVDHALDSLAVPLAGIAGTAVMASTMADLNPAMTWTLAIIAGGGAAAVIKGAAATTRVASTATTAGVANPVVAVAETGTSIVMSVLAVFLPVVAVVVVAVVLWLLYRLFRRVRSGRMAAL